ncbi:hypothetical protein ES707_11398 [subsurface metagenome]
MFGWLRKHGYGVGGLILLFPELWRAFKWLLGWGGAVDLVMERSTDPKWVGAVLSVLASPPPYLTIPLIVAGLVLIYLDLRRSNNLSILHAADQASFRRPDLEPWHLITIGMAGVLLFALVALGSVIWQGRRTPAGEPPIAQVEPVSTQVTVEATMIPAPYYTRTDVDRILEALFEISDLIGKSTRPLEESADNLLRKWNETLLTSGEPEFRSQAKQLRLKIEAIEKKSWDIINNNQHYTKELAPVFLDRAPMQNFLEKFRVLVQAGETLGPSIDQRTLTLLEPMRNETVRAYADLRQWLSDVANKAAQETARFRAMAHKTVK